MKQQLLDTLEQIAGKENIFRYHSGTGLPISEQVQQMYKYMQSAHTGIDRNCDRTFCGMSYAVKYITNTKERKK